MNTEQLALLAILIVSFALSLHASEGFKAYVAQFDPSYGDTIKYIPLSLRNATFDSAANCICDALPNVSGLSLFWAFRLSRRDIRILVVRDGILLSSLAAFVSSFTIYLATFILGLGVCAYISTPKHLWSLNVVKTCVSRVQCSPSTETFNFPGIPVFTLSPLMFWFIFILLRNIWVLSSVFNTRRNWISLCSAISKRCEDWNLPELLWWPFISSQEIAEFLTPGDTRNWICSSHGRSVYDALAISCKTSGCDRKRRRYWYIYTIESTTLPATIPYESIPIVSAPHRFKFAPFLVGFYPGLRIEMLLKTMYIASFIEISNPLVDPKQLFISSTDAYLNDTSGYTLVERGKLPRDQLESFKSYFILIRQTMSRPGMDSFSFSGDQESLECCGAMFDVFLKFLLLMPHLAQNLDLTPWGRPINIPPFVPNVIIPPNVNAVPDNIIPNGQTLIIPPQRNGISGTLGNGTLENNITNGGAPETDENGQQTSPIQVPAAQQIPPPPETGPPPLGPFQRLVPTIPYFFRPSNIQPTPTVGGYKYLHVCVGSKTRPKLCDIALQPQEEDNQIFHRINLLYNSERGRHRTFFSCMRLQRIERVKVHPFSNLTKKFQLLPWYYINILQVYHDFDAGPTELRHYLDHPQSGRGLKLYRDQFPLYHEQFTGPIDLVNPPEAFGIQLVECLSVWWIIIWSMVYLFGTLMFGVSWWFIKKDIQATFLATVIFASCGILITIGIVAKSFEVE